MTKEPQETVDDGNDGGNRMLQIMDTRFGPGIGDGDYICMKFDGDINKINEIGLKSKLGDIKKDDDEFYVDLGKSEIISTEIVGPPLLEYDDKNSDEEPPWNEEA
jgi:hypothetical protein